MISSVTNLFASATAAKQGFKVQTYDDKIDAMYEAERQLANDDFRMEALLADCEWAMRHNIEDKRNTERLEAYRVLLSKCDPMPGI